MFSCFLPGPLLAVVICKGVLIFSKNLSNLSEYCFPGYFNVVYKGICKYFGFCCIGTTVQLLTRHPDPLKSTAPELHVCRSDWSTPKGFKTGEIKERSWDCESAQSRFLGFLRFLLSILDFVVLGRLYSC